MKIVYISIYFILIAHTCLSQASKHKDVEILFYNVENLFDNVDDSLTNDNEFLPFSVRCWTWRKYTQKCNNISKVIISAGKWHMPDIIALCEIENEFVLKGIFNHGPLSKIPYSIIHKNSNDHRGIDVALMYNSKYIRPLKVRFLKLNTGADSISKTREILYLKALVYNKDSIHIFVNHWPSRWGGLLETQHKRIKAAKVLRISVDSIFKVNRNAKIICMGDFNDSPSDKSLKTVLKARCLHKPIIVDNLYNLSYNSVNSFGGTHKYKSKWSFIDQFIVSGKLLNASKGLFCKQNAMRVVEDEFLLEYDKKYLGYKPYRTFIGYRYRNAFSDHLPIVLTIGNY